MCVIYLFRLVGVEKMGPKWWNMFNMLLIPNPEYPNLARTIVTWLATKGM